ncbi:MAG: GNAT family N-acetyltransferase [Leptolyngbyaceae cyanobacterium SM2_5_2]|nr:GNAT family N-acetyltransferase [Leptolyngbyaceae cyanobacterium SM2_5_2]
MLLAVSPAYQRQGIGHQLIQPVLEESDRQGKPCYVETSTAGAVQFYQRHGFEILQTGPFGHQTSPFWTMQRQPVGAIAGATTARSAPGQLTDL